MTERTPITQSTSEWTPQLDTILPIDGPSLPGFVAWVNWNGFREYGQKIRPHFGYDFAAYIRHDNTVVVGLPEHQPVVAVADGWVSHTYTTLPYSQFVVVEHGIGKGMHSEYHHIIPCVAPETSVRKGDVLGYLYKDESGETGRLVHLHFGLFRPWRPAEGFSLAEINSNAVDPSVLDEAIIRYSAVPPVSHRFDIQGLENIHIEFTNFRTVLFE